LTHVLIDDKFTFMKSQLSQLNAQQLRLASEIKQKIEALEMELAKILAPGQPVAGPAIPRRKKKRMSAAARAKIAASQTTRWAERKNKAVAAPQAPAPAKRQISAAGLAKIAAASKAHWAKVRAQKKSGAAGEK
jgi:hypothetical protein